MSVNFSAAETLASSSAGDFLTIAHQVTYLPGVEVVVSTEIIYQHPATWRSPWTSSLVLRN
jgi:hypothetical protein